MAPRKPNNNRSAQRAPNARRAVLEILAQIFEHRQTYDHAFADHDFASQLSDRDRHWVRLVVMTVLRHRFALQAVAVTFVKARIPKKHARVNYALWAGAVELYVMHAKSHAVVHEWVEVIKHSPSNHAKGMVNAVLRRMAEQPELWQEHHTTPPRGWLWKSWIDAYGLETTVQIAEVSQQVPPLDLTCKQDADKWSEKLEGILLTNGSVRLQSAGDITQLEGYNEGAWWVQDAAATLPVQLIADVQGKRVLDLCAAPGGKTAQLASMGAQVMALDRSQGRTKRLRDNMQRLELVVDTVVADALAWQPEGPFDAILLDAPCTATGTLRRHPELPFIKSKEDVAEMVTLQQQLLEKASEWLEPGGVLIYCVCSLQPEEGEAQIDAFLNGQTTMQRHAVTKQDLPMDLAMSITKSGDVRTLPSFWQEQGGMDGFFISRLVKEPQ
jgi:16S rRNA (cytosine967-C5)-methyltransferase